LSKARRFAGGNQTERHMEALAIVAGALRRWGRAFGPYLMLEILLPGGTLLALLLYLYRRRGARA
jgi:hypothetical protein